MKIFDSIQLRQSGPICQQCAHFQNDPAFIEEVYRGLTAMSSGFAAVRDMDGFCQHHQLYLSARDSCPSHAVRTTEFNQEEGEKC